MICERCGAPISETHICIPTAAYLERRILKLETRLDELEKIIENLSGKKSSRESGPRAPGSAEK